MVSLKSGIRKRPYKAVANRISGSFDLNVLGIEIDVLVY
jgi:hypothetical protein